MRVKSVHHLGKPILKALSVLQPEGASTYRAYRNYAAFRNTIEAIPPTFWGTPPDIVYHSNPVHTKPVPERPHTEGVVILQWLWEILKCREVWRDHSCKMTQYLQCLPVVLPDTPGAIKLIVVDVPANEGQMLEVAIPLSDGTLVDEFRLIPSDDEAREISSRCVT